MSLALTTVRSSWGNVSLTGLIRYCGSKQLTTDITRSVVSKVFGNPVNDHTLHMQLGLGRKGQKLPELAPNQVTRVRRIVFTSEGKRLKGLMTALAA